MELDNGLVLNVTDDVKLDEIAGTISTLRQDSAARSVNTVEADGYFILNNIELAGWYVNGHLLRAVTKTMIILVMS